MTDTIAQSPVSQPDGTTRWHLEQSLEGLVRGTLAAVIVAVAHVFTLIPSGVSLVPGLLAVAGTAALTLGPLVALRRSAGAWPPGTHSLIVGTLAALPLLALLGSVLFSGTHHRPLGAVTFSMLAIGLIVAGVVIVGRLADPTRHLLRAPWAVRFDRALGFLWFGFVGGVVLLRALRTPDAAPVFSAAWQFAAVVAAFVGASVSPWPRKTSPVVRVSGALSWVFLVVTSLVVLHHGEDFASAVLRAAPIVAWPWAGYR